MLGTPSPLSGSCRVESKPCYHLAAFDRLGAEMLEEPVIYQCRSNRTQHLKSVGIAVPGHAREGPVVSNVCRCVDATIQLLGTN